MDVYYLILFSKNQILNDSIKNFTYTESEQMSRRKKWVETLECVWVAAIIVDLVFQCLPRYDTPPEKLLQFGMSPAVDPSLRTYWSHVSLVN